MQSYSYRILLTHYSTQTVVYRVDLPFPVHTQRITGSGQVIQSLYPNHCIGRVRTGQDGSVEPLPPLDSSSLPLLVSAHTHSQSIIIIMHQKHIDVNSACRTYADHSIYAQDFEHFDHYIAKSNISNKSNTFHMNIQNHMNIGSFDRSTIITLVIPSLVQTKHRTRA